MIMMMTTMNIKNIFSGQNIALFNVHSRCVRDNDSPLNDYEMTIKQHAIYEVFGDESIVGLDQYGHPLTWEIFRMSE